MKERIQKILSKGSYCSRRDAEKLIKEGRVKVNNLVATLGDKCDEDAIIQIDNKEIKLKFTKVYYLLNKPKGYISSTKDKKGKQIVNLIHTSDYIFPVGRLDYDTTGLIILTNDGEFSRQITLPKSKLEKTYLITIDNILLEDQMKLFYRGIVLDDDYKTLPVIKIEIVDLNDKLKTSKIKLTIIEGKKNQVKRMFKTMDINVLDLQRIQIGNLQLTNNLKIGQYRKLTQNEVDQLWKLSLNK